MEHGAREHRGRERGISAAVGREIDLHRQQLAVAVKRRAMAHARRMSLGGRGQIFHAVVDHLHRMAALHGEQRRVARDDGGIILFAAECAAGFSLDDANLVIGQIEDGTQSFENVVRALQRAPHRDAALRAVLRDHALVLDVKMFLRAGAVLALDDVRRASPRGIYVAFFEQENFEQIVRAPDDHILPLALFNGEDGRQRFVFDLHRADGFAQFVLVGMREEQDRLFAMIHFAVGEAGLIGDDELDAIFAGNVGGGNDRELAPVDAAVKCNGANQPARNCTAHRGAVPHAFALHIVDVAARGPAACPRLPCGEQRRRRCGLSQACSWLPKPVSPTG